MTLAQKDLQYPDIRPADCLSSVVLADVVTFATNKRAQMSGSYFPAWRPTPHICGSQNAAARTPSPSHTNTHIPVPSPRTSSSGRVI